MNWKKITPAWEDWFNSFILREYNNFLRFRKSMISIKYQWYKIQKDINDRRHPVLICFCLMKGHAALFRPKRVVALVLCIEWRSIAKLLLLLLFNTTCVLFVTQCKMKQFVFKWHKMHKTIVLGYNNLLPPFITLHLRILLCFCLRVGLVPAFTPDEGSS